MFAEIPSYLPWALTVAALSLVFVQGLVLGRQVRSLRATLKERCDTLGRELHATTSGSMGVGQDHARRNAPERSAANLLR